METTIRAARRCIGLDVHRDFAQVAIWQDGRVSQAGRFATTPEQVRAFADGLGPGDEVALAATGNAWGIATLLASRAPLDTVAPGTFRDLGSLMLAFVRDAARPQKVRVG